jgi:hypothetical protein
MKARRANARYVLALGAGLLLCYAGPAAAATLTIPGTANIFGAGHPGPPQTTTACNNEVPATWGTLPPGVSFPAAADQVLTFSSVSGIADWGANDRPTGPDGWPESQDISSVDGIAGIIDPTHRFYLTGVFVTDAEPADPAPPRLSFGAHNFASLLPGLNQTFFIGDGLTGTGAGGVQKFNVPPTATRLYLGLTDAFDFVGPPGCFNGNSGSLSATFTIGGQTLEPVPPPGEPPAPVGSVTEIRTKSGKGKPRAEILRDGGWQRLRVGDDLAPGDRVRTDEDTVMAIELDLGGRVHVRANSNVEILGERSVRGLDAQGFELTKGGVWAKCGQMKESLEIQTTGGVIGIKG